MGEKTTSTDFTRTREALKEYDATEGERQTLWDAAMTRKDFRVAEAKDLEALNQVREAFYLDTKHVNSRDRAMLVSLSDLRHLTREH